MNVEKKKVCVQFLMLWLGKFKSAEKERLANKGENYEPAHLLLF